MSGIALLGGSCETREMTVGFIGSGWNGGVTRTVSLLGIQRKNLTRAMIVVCATIYMQVVLSCLFSRSWLVGWAAMVPPRDKESS